MCERERDREREREREIYIEVVCVHASTYASGHWNTIADREKLLLTLQSMNYVCHKLSKSFSTCLILNCIHRYRPAGTGSYRGEVRTGWLGTGGVPETKERGTPRHAEGSDPETGETRGEVPAGLSQTVQREDGRQASGARLAEEPESVRGTRRTKGVFVMTSVNAFIC